MAKKMSKSPGWTEEDMEEELIDGQPADEPLGPMEGLGGAAAQVPTMSVIPSSPRKDKSREVTIEDIGSDSEEDDTMYYSTESSSEESFTPSEWRTVRFLPGAHDIPPKYSTVRSVLPSLAPVRDPSPVDLPEKVARTVIPELGTDLQVVPMIKPPVTEPATVVKSSSQELKPVPKPPGSRAAKGASGAVFPETAQETEGGSQITAGFPETARPNRPWEMSAVGSPADPEPVSASGFETARPNRATEGPTAGKPASGAPVSSGSQSRKRSEPIPIPVARPRSSYQGEQGMVYDDECAELAGQGSFPHGGFTSAQASRAPSAGEPQPDSARRRSRGRKDGDPASLPRSGVREKPQVSTPFGPNPPNLGAAASRVGRDHSPVCVDPYGNVLPDMERIGTDRVCYSSRGLRRRLDRRARGEPEPPIESIPEKKFTLEEAREYLQDEIQEKASVLAQERMAFQSTPWRQADPDREQFMTMKQVRQLLKDQAENNARLVKQSSIPDATGDHSSQAALLTSLVESQQALVNKKKTLTLESFSGDEPNDDWLDYEAKFQRMAKRHKWTEEEQLDQLVCHLKGTALAVYGDLDSDKGSDLLALLRGRFAPKGSEDNFKGKFSRRTLEENEEPEAYAQALRRLARRAFPSVPQCGRDEMVLHQFGQGLTDLELRKQYSMARCKTLEEAIATVAAYRNFVSTQYPRIVKPTTRAAGKVAAAQPTRRNSSGWSKRVMTCWCCQEEGHGFARCPRNRDGHYQPDDEKKRRLASWENRKKRSSNPPSSTAGTTSTDATPKN